MVLEGGDGPPLVLLHGGIECGGAYWAPVIAPLAERHRVIVPDLPGLGESEPVARLDAATFADWFAALLRETCEGTADADRALTPRQPRRAPGGRPPRTSSAAW